MTSGSTSSASWTTARPLPVRRSAVKTSSSVKRWRPNRRSLVEVEVARRPLLEPEPVVFRRLLQEVRRLLQKVLGVLVGGDVVHRPAPLRVLGVGGRELARVVHARLVLLEPGAAGARGGWRLVQRGRRLGRLLDVRREVVLAPLRRLVRILGIRPRERLAGRRAGRIAPDRPEGLGLQAADLLLGGAGALLELQVLAD